MKFARFFKLVIKFSFLKKILLLKSYIIIELYYNNLSFIYFNLLLNIRLNNILLAKK